MKPFYELSNAGRTSRVRRLALEALQNFDLKVIGLRPLKVSFNNVFRVDTASGNRYALRIIHPDATSLEELRSEMIWLEAIRHDLKLIVPSPVPTRNGETVLEVTTSEIPEARYCSLFNWIKGHHVLRRPSQALLYKQGFVMAQLHEQARTFSPPANFCRKQLNTVWPYGKPELIYSNQPNALFSAELKAIVQELAGRVEATFAELATSSYDKIQLIHGDLNLGNLKLEQGVLHILDFDRCGWGYPAQDIAIAFYYLPPNLPDYSGLFEAFKKGYTAVRPWQEVYNRSLNTLMLARRLELLNWLLASPISELKLWLPHWLKGAEHEMRKLVA